MIKKNSLGYTLIELTIVMALLIVVGGLLIGIISSALRGSTKTKITNDVAQNGNYALSVMTNIIANAQQFESFSSTSPITAVLTRCDRDTATGRAGPFTGDKVTVVGFDGGITELSCGVGGTISSNSAVLIDNSRVRVASCSLTCSQSSLYSPPRIDVEFSLVNASGGTAESAGSASFNTSVSFRNSNLN